MSNQRFDDFVAKELNEAEQNKLSFSRRVVEFGQDVKGFFDTVAKFLEPYQASQKITVTYRPDLLEEKPFGQIESKVAEIKLGSKVVTLAPQGLNIIGARGRVDMIGPAQTLMFLLVGKDVTSVKFVSKRASDLSVSELPSEWLWKLVTPPPVRFIEMTETVFFDALMEAIGSPE